MTQIDVLIPTFQRPGALAVTLTSLLAQTFPDFSIIVSDQTRDDSSLLSPLVQTAASLHMLQGRKVSLLRHLPRRGLAEQRQFLLDQADAPLVLFLDDDVTVNATLLERLVATMEEQRCGFVGSGLIGLSYLQDLRPEEQAIEFWKGAVEPEVVMPGSAAWERHRLHNAANLLHVQQKLGLTERERLAYKVAWVGGCVLFDIEKLRESGGFDFWPLLPVDHCGEDVLAQLRVMARYGGCGLLPSGAYHQQVETSVPGPSRANDAPLLLPHLIDEHASPGRR